MGNRPPGSLPYPCDRQTAGDLDRPFVAAPLLEIVPPLVLPDAGRPLCCSFPDAAGAGMDPLPVLTRTLPEELKR